MSESYTTCPPDGEQEQTVDAACEIVSADNTTPSSIGNTAPVHAAESSCCETNSALPCYTEWCEDAFQSLPPASRIHLIGTNGKCMYRFDSRKPGLIMADGAGGFLFTQAPALDLPQLVSFVTKSDGSILLNADRTHAEAEPPAFGYLMVQATDSGEWMKLRGGQDRPGMLVWDGTNFNMVGMDEANVSVSRPDDSCDEAEAVGFATPECDDGTDNILKRFYSDIDGVLYFNTTTGKTKITSICEVFAEEAERSTRVPFIPSCSDGDPIRFKGSKSEDGMLYWDHFSGEWVIMDLDEKACDPECGCATYLTPIYDCVTGTWQITEEPVHVLTWKAWSDSGVATSIDFTLPWPALVNIYALRRMIPNIGDTTVVSADIYVDGCKVTSPSDGGLVGNLGEAATSTGMAIIPLAAGDHTVYVSNTQTAGGGTPNWDGAWLKVFAHKAVECSPGKDAIGEGDIDEGTGGGGGGPAGPIGPQGDVGPQGEPGLPGSDGLVPDDSLLCDVLAGITVENIAGKENCQKLVFQKATHQTLAGVLDCNNAGVEEVEVNICTGAGSPPEDSPIYEVISGVSFLPGAAPDCTQIKFTTANIQTDDGVLTATDTGSQYVDVKDCGAGESYPDYDPAEPTDPGGNQYFIPKMNPSGDVSFVVLDIMEMEICVGGVPTTKQVAIIQ